MQISQKQNEPDIDEVEASGIIKTLENRLNILQDEHEELVEKCKYIWWSFKPISVSVFKELGNWDLSAFNEVQVND